MTSNEFNQESIKRKVGKTQYDLWVHEANGRYNTAMRQPKYVEGPNGSKIKRESRKHFEREYVLESYFTHCLAQSESQELPRA